MTSDPHAAADTATGSAPLTAPAAHAAPAPAPPTPDSADKTGLSAGATAPRLLIIDDEEANRESLQRVFEREGFSVRTAESGDRALDVLRREPFAVALVDLMMPGMTGLEFLRAARLVAPDCDVIVMTAYGTVETAVDAMKEGAYDFITKPIKRLAVVKAVRRAVEKQTLLSENRALRAELVDLSGRDQDRRIIGRSPVMLRLLDTLRQAAPSTATVLLTGESGTGKELLAREIHALSVAAGRNGPFVAVNMGALPEGIVESELFGHEKGAFTGATAQGIGRFERANRGTLFLDEIGEAPPLVQVKLLRAVQEGEIERVGGHTPIRLDTRVVAATNVDLEREVADGRFREDLYYRLNVITIRVPPLRERVEDIPLLAEEFIRKHGTRHHREVTGLTREALDRLMAWRWPGNVRELENAVERAVVLARGPVLGVEDFPPHIASVDPKGGPSHGHHAGAASVGAGAAVQFTFPFGTPLAEIEMQVIQETLRQVSGDKGLAARLLGIATRTIYRRLEERDAEKDAGKPGE